ncbi:MAG: hypothetical protein EI684_21620 [Candidatus Viridilinea halotolerans]|uniref:Uncharacterized protein n=1 Tax=Candidatus Viridilinea halotolerans TaxID=2491704 RepID=A0A426TR95_9CHLR|nr:MAG: hypothetical protein EI684_21620 [Candidatus Viridilinea halotolerans]
MSNQLNTALETLLASNPLFVQVRALLRQLEEEREHWPVLLPLLAMLFVVVYRRERARVQALLRLDRRGG